MSAAALARIPVGVVVERCKARNPVIDFLWRPVLVLVGCPMATPWTFLRAQGNSDWYYAGNAAIELFRTETTNYRDNLATRAPVLWVILHASWSHVGYDLLSVTADPAEGEAFTNAGTDLVETLPMPASIAAAIADFIAEHHVERQFTKRRRTSVDPMSACRGQIVRGNVR